MKRIHGQTTDRELKRLGGTSGEAHASLPRSDFSFTRFLTTKTHPPFHSEQHKTVLTADQTGPDRTGPVRAGPDHPVQKLNLHGILTVPRHSTSPPSHLLCPLLCCPEVSVHCRRRRRRLLPITAVSRRPLRRPRESRPQQGCRLST